MLVNRARLAELLMMVATRRTFSPIFISGGKNFWEKFLFLPHIISLPDLLYEFS